MPIDRVDEPQVVPWLEKDDLAYYGPFRDNVRSFIETETEPDDCFVEGGVLGHTVTLGKGTEHEATLRVYEETMLESTRVHCDCCRCIGWHHHPVTRKQYHFIIHTDFRVDSKPELAGKRVCQICTAAAPAKEKICPACGENDKETSILDYQTHLMHGTLHANGCGHLMRINGREAGSRHLSGQQLIQIWELLCNTLRAREVSVEDVSQKYGVEFRLLNPVACGKTWYGTYGYQFGKGSFGNTAATHRKAAERLRSFPLESVKRDFKNLAKNGESNGSSLVDEAPLEIIARYEVLMKKYAPKTLGGLVALLLLLQRIVRRNDKAEKELVLSERRKAGKKDAKRGEGANADSDSNCAAEKVARRREEEREAAVKRKAASSLFEPLKFESKATKASKLSDGAKGGLRNVRGPSGGPTRVMSSAKPRVTPTRPLRPRGADGLVPPTEPEFAAEPANPASEAHPARRAREAKREGMPPAPAPAPLEPSRAALASKTHALPPTGKIKTEAPDVPSSSSRRVSRWSDARIETACTSCVEVLREANGKWMARQDVRALARDKGVGDTGLLDHVLKTISDAKVTLVTLDKHRNPTGKTTRAKVRRRQNGSTGQLEYHLDKVDGMRKMRAKVAPPKPKPRDEAVAKKTKTELEPAKAAVSRDGALGGKLCSAPGGKGVSGERRAAEEAARQLSTTDLDRDVRAVYTSLLASYEPARPRSSKSGAPSASAAKCEGWDLIQRARVLLDTKQFVKTYVPVEELLESRPKAGNARVKASTAIRVMVTAVIDSRNRGPKVSGMGFGSGAGGGGQKSKSAKRRQKHGVETKPPPEVILLPSDPTLGDFKAAAAKCFQDLYVVLGKFKVKTVVGFETAKDATKIGKKIAGKRVEVHGEGADLESEFRYQGGLDQWTVRCVCGTTDDDGERMIACDACEVWMHTRCVGIVDSAGTPRRWTCLDCEAEAAKAAKAAKASGGKSSKNAEPAKKKPQPPPPVERVRPPPTIRRPLPVRVMPRRKGAAR